jgi:meso-butanediol dehydrogenase / (S,S)-butanediol dehydrogenase / diacetyl reductase
MVPENSGGDAVSGSYEMGDAEAGKATEPIEIFAGRFDGNVALVTGAASGIGRATARRLAAEGAAVACCDLNPENVRDVVSEITSAGGTAAAFVCDVTNEQSVIDTVKEAAASLGRINVVCNSAGIGAFAHTDQQSLDGWNKILGVNLTGTFLVCRETLPHLLEGGGVIVNVSSTAGVMGQAYSAAYCASKGGVTMMTKGIAIEYASRGVRCNAVAPGGVNTPLVRNFGLPEGADYKQLDRIMTPMGITTPAEIAGAITYLCSDEASYATGSILSIDGGISA